jgi:hypothetical protein
MTNVPARPAPAPVRCRLSADRQSGELATVPLAPDLDDGIDQRPDGNRPAGRIEQHSKRDGFDVGGSSQDEIGNPSRLTDVATLRPSSRDESRPAVVFVTGRPLDKSPDRPVTNSHPSRDESSRDEQPSVTGRKPAKVLKLQRHRTSQPDNPSRDGWRPKAQAQSGTKRCNKPVSGTEGEIKSLLPDLQDGGRWTVENEGYGWKVRRVWDVDKSTKSTRFFRLRWATWELMKERYSDEQIRSIFADRVYRKQRDLIRLAAPRRA